MHCLDRALQSSICILSLGHANACFPLHPTHPPNPHTHSGMQCAAGGCSSVQAELGPSVGGITGILSLQDAGKWSIVLLPRSWSADACFLR